MNGKKNLHFLLNLPNVLTTIEVFLF